MRKRTRKQCPLTSWLRLVHKSEKFDQTNKLNLWHKVNGKINSIEENELSKKSFGKTRAIMRKATCIGVVEHVLATIEGKHKKSAEKHHLNVSDKHRANANSQIVYPKTHFVSNNHFFINKKCVKKKTRKISTKKIKNAFLF